LGASRFEASQKKFMRPHLNQELGMAMHIYHPSCEGEQKIGGLQFGRTWAKVRPYLQNNQSKKKDW
jgi:hypothetical protein